MAEDPTKMPADIDAGKTPVVLDVPSPDGPGDRKGRAALVSALSAKGLVTRVAPEEWHELEVGGDLYRLIDVAAANKLPARALLDAWLSGGELALYVRKKPAGIWAFSEAEPDPFRAIDGLVEVDRDDESARLLLDRDWAHVMTIDWLPEMIRESGVCLSTDRALRSRQVVRHADLIVCRGGGLAAIAGGGVLDVGLALPPASRRLVRRFIDDADQADTDIADQALEVGGESRPAIRRGRQPATDELETRILAIADDVNGSTLTAIPRGRGEQSQAKFAEKIIARAKAHGKPIESGVTNVLKLLRRAISARNLRMRKTE